MQTVNTDSGHDSTSLLTADDIYYFREGSASRLHDKLGAHPMRAGEVEGTHFAVWAPNAETVSVVGDFNDWRPGATPLAARADGAGIWEGFVAGVGHGAAYKFHVASRHNGYQAAKADPFARYAEVPPATASRVWNLDYEWHDQTWMATRAKHNALDAPMSIYEMHPGSWRRKPEENDRPLTWRELAEPLADYLCEMGFTHVELMPVMEHPFYGSWGYQVTGYFAPSARYGTPQDFMFLVDHLHQRGLGVILDWVPSHFPSDEHGLGYFDGTHLFEHADPRQGFHPEWGSCIFNYGRNEVRAFLVSNALFWLERYHVDGLRVDAVASMLYRDYARKAGEWIPNEHGGRENLEAVVFLRQLNEAVYREFPDVQTIAEESTAWPQVSRPVYLGGLGFGMKWNMGWMHDTLGYFAHDPIHRRYHHNEITFSVWYAFNENFALPLSHDEVVHGKGSLINKMPGDEASRFANLRALYGYMYAHPGKKLLFMGCEFGQWREWNHDSSLDWHLLEDERHRGLSRWLRDLNLAYRDEPALHRQDFAQAGFEWVDASDYQDSVIAFLRHSGAGESVLVVCNFTPVTRDGYRVGVPDSGYWHELLNSDAESYGGSGAGNFGGVRTRPLPAHGRYHSLTLTLPPDGVLFLKAAS